MCLPVPFSSIQNKSGEKEKGECVFFRQLNRFHLRDSPLKNKQKKNQPIFLVFDMKVIIFTTFFFFNILLGKDLKLATACQCSEILNFFYPLV